MLLGRTRLEEQVEAEIRTQCIPIERHQFSKGLLKLSMLVKLERWRVQATKQQCSKSR